MKQSGQCPKCNGTEIWNNSHYSIEKNVRLKRWILVRWSLTPWKRKYAFKDEYVCLDCGYSETFIDSKGLETIKEFGYPEGK